MLVLKLQGVEQGAELAIGNEIQFIYFGAWLLELFPTNPRRVCQCFLRNVSLAQKGHSQINKRPGIGIKVLVSGVSMTLKLTGRQDGNVEINVETCLNQVLRYFHVIKVYKCHRSR